MRISHPISFLLLLIASSEAYETVDDWYDYQEVIYDNSKVRETPNIISSPEKIVSYKTKNRSFLIQPARKSGKERSLTMSC